jgi:MFS superfamily sulfate permease-like transporter
MWVTFASGYQVVYQALVVILAGLILYAFLNARRQRLGESVEPVELVPEAVVAGATNGTAHAEVSEPSTVQHVEVTP